MRGSKPTPAALRELLGQRTRKHHHDRVPNENDPEQGNALAAAAVDIPAPAGLVKAERAYWNEFAPLLAGAKVLTPADVQTLADYCRACYWVEDSTRRLRTAWRRRNPELRKIRMLDAQARGWVERKTKLASELGLTAISRSRVAWSGHEQVVNKQKRPMSKLAELQEQARDLHRPIAVAKETA